MTTLTMPDNLIRALANLGQITVPLGDVMDVEGLYSLGISLKQYREEVASATTTHLSPVKAAEELIKEALLEKLGDQKTISYDHGGRVTKRTTVSAKVMDPAAFLNYAMEHDYGLIGSVSIPVKELSQYKATNDEALPPGVAESKSESVLLYPPKQ